MKTKPAARRLLKILLLVILVLLVAHIVMQFLNLEVYNEKQGQVFELSNRLDVDDEVSLPTWFSQFILLSIGVSALLVARLEAKLPVRRAWKLIGIGGILFSIDEVVGIHELVLQTAHLLYYGEVVPTAALNAWWLMLPFIGAIGLFLLYWLYKVLPRRTWLLFFGAGGLYLIGAAGFELFSNDFSKLSYMYQGVLSAVEEGFEMVGAVVVLYSIIDYLETYHKPKLEAALQVLSPTKHDT